MRGLTLGLGFSRRPVGDGSNLDLDFRSMSELPSYMTFSRGTLGTCFDSAGVMRFCDHNLLLRSEEFNNPAWTQNNVTVTANAATSPNGYLTADAVIASASLNTFKELQQGSSVTSGVTYTYSAFVKDAGYRYVQLVGQSGIFGTFYVNFDLQSGTEVAFDAGTSTVVGRGISEIGDGWFRVYCSVTCLSTTSGRMALNIIPDASSVRGVAWSGDGTSGIYLWGAQLNQGSEVLPYRATTSSAYYGPRFTHDPATLAPLGYLAEGQRTNWLLYTTLPGGGSPPTGWTAVSGSGTAAESIYGNADGASAYTFTSSASRNYFSQSFTLVSNTTYTFSVLIEEASGTTTYNNVCTVAGLPAGCNITGWTIDGAAVASGDVATTGRLTFTIGGTYTGASSSFRIGCGTSGTATGTVTLSRPQLEAASFPSSYIPTTTAAATRNADSLTITGTAATSRINNAEGTLLVHYTYLDPSDTSVTRRAAAISGASGANRIQFYGSASSTYNHAEVITSIVSQYNGAANATVSHKQTVRCAIAYKADDCRGARNGVLAPADVAPSTLGTYDTFSIGTDIPGREVFLPIARVKYWPIRLTDAQLASITA